MTMPRPDMNRSTVWLLSALFASACVIRLAADDRQYAPSQAYSAAEAGPATTPQLDDPPLEKPKQRQREGAKLADRRGRFERRGERYVFLSEEPVAHFFVLENLMLERVANVLADAAGGQLRWSVTGTVTEFRGSNFLLVDRAVVKAVQGDGEPRTLTDVHARSEARPLPTN